MAVEVRPCRPDERADWEPLWRDYLAFYETVLPPAIYDLTWRRLHDPAEPTFLLGGYVDGTMKGIVHYLFHRSNWTRADVCYLQDLYVAPDTRGAGLGRALIEAVADKAREAGSPRLYWMTHEDNRTARALYDAVAERSGFIQYVKPL